MKAKRVWKSSRPLWSRLADIFDFFRTRIFSVLNVPSASKMTAGFAITLKKSLGSSVCHGPGGDQQRRPRHRPQLLQHRPQGQSVHQHRGHWVSCGPLDKCCGCWEAVYRIRRQRTRPLGPSNSWRATSPILASGGMASKFPWFKSEGLLSLGQVRGQCLQDSSQSYNRIKKVHYYCSQIPWFRGGNQSSLCSSRPCCTCPCSRWRKYWIKVFKNII